jgi:murein DD-endopeptidase MepM/ murein hydrolase activator NlpD
MANRFYTLMIIPERTAKLIKWVIPSWLFRGSIIGFAFLCGLVFMMLIDYVYVMSQIDENRDLKNENRRLRSQIQVYKNRMDSIEDTIDRVQTFTTRLRVITNFEDREDISKLLERELPDASQNVGTKNVKQDADPANPNAPFQASEERPDLADLDKRDPERKRLIDEQSSIEKIFSDTHSKSLALEQNLQDLYELLADQKQFLAALPTQKPAAGYFTSGFGIRPSPFGGVEKMHEGLDIANWSGTAITSTANGVVKFSGNKPGYGRTVIVDHGYGLETWYAHIRSSSVKEGEKVRRGQMIATMGSTGRSTGPHVHYEVRVHGIPVDPLSYILEQ